MKNEYIPKGGMCAVCVNRDNDCSGLPFSDYDWIQHPRPVLTGDFIVVKCEEWLRGPPITQKISIEKAE